ncbi:MAG: T9SS type A sorting domain-containing protein [bacterium]
MKKTLIILVLILSSCELLAFDFDFFIKNKGQWDSRVCYLYQSSNRNFWITKDGITIDVFKFESIPAKTNVPGEYLPEKENHQNLTRKGEVIKLNFKNSNINNSELFEDYKQITYFNFLGYKDENKRIKEVPCYGTVTLRNLYKGIDIKYYLEENNLRYDLIVEPGANPGQIQLEFSSCSNIQVDNGELIINSEMGLIKLGNIFAYQEINNAKKEIKCKFVKKSGNTFSFSISNYDTSKKLIIDPLVYIRQISSLGMDFSAGSVQFDNSENVYFSGSTQGKEFPVTDTIYIDSTRKNNFRFIAKMDAITQDFIYCTYFGNRWGVTSFILDNENNINIYGYFIGDNYKDFPVTDDAYQKEGIRDDSYITKISNDGKEVLYSTFLGISKGNNSLEGNTQIMMDIQGNYYIHSYVKSKDSIFISDNALFNTFQGDTINTRDGDAYLLKFNPKEKRIVYATYFGGSSYDYVNCILPDNEGNLYIYGRTQAENFPTTENAFIPEYINVSGDSPMVPFFSIISADGSELLYSTFLSDSSRAVALDMAMDSLGFVYFLGYSSDTRYKLTDTAFQYHYIGNKHRGYIFITKFDWRKNEIVFTAGFSGGSPEPIHLEIYNLLEVDGQNNIYFSDVTLDYPRPVTEDAFSKDITWEKEVYILKLSSDGKEVKYGSYFGGQGYDYPQAMAVTKDGIVYLYGWTGSYDFPFSNGSLARGADIFLAKLDLRDGIGVKDSKIEDSEIRIFPNPASDYIEISVGGRQQTADGRKKIQIFDVYGKRIPVGAIHELPLRIDVSDVPSGLYFMRFEDVIQKFVVMR